MSVYGELDPMVEHRTQFAFKGKREHIAKVSMPNITYSNQHTDIDIPHGSRDHVIIPVPSKLRLILILNQKKRHVVLSIMWVGHSSKKKVLMLSSKDIDMTNNSDIYDTYNDLYLSEKEREKKLFQGIQSVNGLKARVGAEKAEDGTALTLTTQENAIKKTLGERFAIPLDFDFFKHPVYPYGLREDLN